MKSLLDRIKLASTVQATAKAQALSEDEIRRQENEEQYASFKSKLEEIAKVLGQEKQFTDLFGKVSVVSDKYGRPQLFTGSEFLGDAVMDEIDSNYIQIITGLTREDDEIAKFSLVPKETWLYSFIEDDTSCTTDIPIQSDIKEQVLDSVASYIAGLSLSYR